MFTIFCDLRLVCKCRGDFESLRHFVFWRETIGFQKVATFFQMTNLNPQLRIAPTPSGFLHLGNGVNFLLNWQEARKSPGGKLLLRIDDLDAERKRPEFVEDIFETLDWLGIDWDEGPKSAEDFEKNWSQQHRLSLYFNALQILREQDLLFGCRKSRADLAPFFGKYPPEFRHQNLSLDEPDVAWRIKTPTDFPLPDFVVRRRDGVPAYQIASVCDDVFFKITKIIRGEDLLQSSLAQRFIAEKLGWDDFLKIEILHHPLVKNEVGEKLSKSAGAGSLRAMRMAGESPQVVFDLLEKFI